MITTICTFIIMSWSVYGSPADAVAVCHDVLTEANLAGVDLPLAAALSYTESRFRPDAESGAGAVGPLQVLPKYHCPGKKRAGCDVIRAGIVALLRFMEKFGGKGLDGVLCHWNSGNSCFSKSRKFAATVQRRARLIRRSIGVGAK